MKRRVLYGFYLLVLIANLSKCVYAQTGDSKLNESYLRVNMAVPDNPAFKALGTSDIQLLRPSTPKELALTLSQFYKGSQFIIPTYFGIEIAPYRLATNARPLTDLRKYLEYRSIKSSRLSVGAVRGLNQSAISQLSLGYRITIVHENYDRIYDELKNAVNNQLNNHLFCLKKLNITEIQYVADSALKEACDHCEEETRLKENSAPFKDKARWNKGIHDVALSMLWNAKDTLVKTLKSKSFHAWYTAGFSLNTTWAQLLVGANFNYNFQPETQNPWNFLPAAQLFIGANEYKGFIEVQNRFSSDTSSFYLGTGTEISLLNGVWLQLHLGVVKDWNQNQQSRFVSNFDLKFTLPEKKKE